MKSSLMKLNHVSTFLGKGQVEIEYNDKLRGARKREFVTVTLWINCSVDSFIEIFLS